jgi:hypothetical protein
LLWARLARGAALSPIQTVITFTFPPKQHGEESFDGETFALFSADFQLFSVCGRE